MILEPIFVALNDAGVRYVIVGGLATVLHGFSRLTHDVDLAIDLVPPEAAKVIAVLTLMGFCPRAPVDARDFAGFRDGAKIRKFHYAWAAECHFPDLRYVPKFPA